MSQVIEITFEVIEPNDRPTYYRVVSRQGKSGENAERFVIIETEDATYAQTVMRQSCKAAVEGRLDRISQPSDAWLDQV